MGEKIKTTHESKDKPSNIEALEQIARERHDASASLEEAERLHRERKHESETVLHEAKKLASERESSDKSAAPATPAERRRGPISKQQLSHSFDSQMSHARERMTPSARVFSKFIHSKPIEKTSEVLGSTLARPNALLSGSIVAFASVTVLYFVAKHYGFQLSGFETIGAFVLGWIIGILYDYFSVMIKGKN